MKIDFGNGVYLEPDGDPRNSPWHKRIVAVRSIPSTRAGHFLDLECGHRAMAFGDLKHAAGVVLCTQCRDCEELPKP
jgi:hypothetical protein